MFILKLCPSGIFSGGMQRGASVLCLMIHIGLIFEKNPYQPATTLLSRRHQGGHTSCIFTINRCSMLEQQPDYILILLAFRHTVWRNTERSSN